MMWESYHIGWICALPVELAAAVSMLDEKHDILPNVSGDPNHYILGRVHDHNVVIACLPSGIDGTNAAAVTAIHLLRTFGFIKCGLMVGIGGGIPDLKKGRDIRLGDIAVSQPTSTNGGVIQYDKGKSLDGQFECKGHLNCPPRVLLTALATLKAEHLKYKSRIPQYLGAMIQKYPEMRESGFKFPEGQADILRCPNGHGTLTGCEICEYGEVKRNHREGKEPRIHYGVIASGNQVIKSAKVRDCINRDYDAICVEMEAAGLMNAFPCLVIRGICDYADTFKNDTWHNYAAATAAAFAKELLLYVPQEVAGRETLARPFSESRELPAPTQQQQVSEYPSTQTQKRGCSASANYGQATPRPKWFDRNAKKIARRTGSRQINA